MATNPAANGPSLPSVLDMLDRANQTLYPGISKLILYYILLLIEGKERRREKMHQIRVMLRKLFYIYIFFYCIIIF